jgi:CBS domain-containing protein
VIGTLDLTQGQVVHGCIMIRQRRGVMLVKQILNTKPMQGVLTIQPAAHVAEAIDELAGRKIGALVVSDYGTTAQGILSERDIVRELAQQGAPVMATRVETVMTRNLQTASPSESAESVLGRMTEGRFRHMPVVEDGALIGIVTLGDVVKARLSEVSMEKDALEAMVSGY